MWGEDRARLRFPVSHCRVLCKPICCFSSFHFESCRLYKQCENQLFASLPRNCLFLFLSFLLPFFFFVSFFFFLFCFFFLPTTVEKSHAKERGLRAVHRRKKTPFDPIFFHSVAWEPHLCCPRGQGSHQVHGQSHKVCFETKKSKCHIHCQLHSQKFN